MKTYSWQSGSVNDGLALMADERLGQIVLLGEAGRGRWFEKVGLDRRNPALKVDGRVFDAHPRKVVLPAKPEEGKKEKTFYVLERPQQGCETKLLVRINTYTGYLKESSGHFTVVKGKPETLISGYGAEGAAGRNGSWTDSLVIVTEGDVLKIHPTRNLSGVYTFAMWVEAGEVKTATWDVYERLQAKVDIAASPKTLAFGTMPCTTYVGRGEFSGGIEIKLGETGTAVILGTEGRGRVRTEVSVIGFETAEILREAAVIELSRKEMPVRFSWEEPKVNVIYGLTSSEQMEKGAHLVRIRPSTSPHRSYIHCETLRGEPTRLALGNFASGDAGNAGSADDALYVIRSSEVVKVGGYWVIQNVDGELQTTPFKDWEVTDAGVDPAPYIAKGIAPWGKVPDEWIGRIVSVVTRKVKMERDGETVYWPEGEKGEIVSLNPFILNMGWDGLDREILSVESGVWVKLHEHLQVKVLEGDERTQRCDAKEEALTLQIAANELRSAKHFSHLDADLRRKIEQLAEGRHVSSYSDAKVLIIPLSPTEDIRSWNGSAKAVLAEAESVRTTLTELVAKIDRGEVLPKFGGHFCRNGATDIRDFWVVAADGAVRKADSTSFTHRRHDDDGEKIWEMVDSDELAISWSKSASEEPHQFKVDKLPVGGRPTRSQIDAVTAIERELTDRFEGYTGNYHVGNGWGLKPQLTPKAVAPVAKGTPVEPGKIDLSELFGGGAKVKTKR